VRAGRLLVSIDASDVQAQVNAIEQQKNRQKRHTSLPSPSMKKNLQRRKFIGIYSKNFGLYS